MLVILVKPLDTYLLGLKNILKVINNHTYTNTFCHHKIAKMQALKNLFSILDQGNTKYELKIKEGLHIGWNNPELNKQVKCLLSSICI